MDNNLCNLDEDIYFDTFINKSVKQYRIEKALLNSAIYLRNKNVGLHRILRIIRFDLEKLLKSDILDGKGIKARESYRDFTKNHMKPLIQDIILILNTLLNKRDAIHLKNNLEDPLINSIAKNLFNNDLEKATILYEEILKYVFIHIVSKWGIQIHLKCRPYNKIKDVITGILDVALYGSIIGFNGWTSNFFARNAIYGISTFQNIKKYFVSGEGINIQKIIENFIKESNQKVVNSQLDHDCVANKTDFCRKLQEEKIIETNNFFRGPVAICKQPDIVEECLPGKLTSGIYVLYDNYNKSKIINQVKEGCFLAKLLSESEYNLVDDNKLILKDLINKIFFIDNKLDFLQKYIQNSDKLNNLAYGNVDSVLEKTLIKGMDQIARTAGYTNWIDFFLKKSLPKWGLSPYCQNHQNADGVLIAGPEIVDIPDQYRIKCAKFGSRVYNNKGECEDNAGCEWEGSYMGGTCKGNPVRNINFIKYKNDPWICTNYVQYIEESDEVYQQKFIGEYSFKPYSDKLVLNINGYNINSVDVSYYQSNFVRSYQLDDNLYISHDCQKKIFAAINNELFENADFSIIDLTYKNQEDKNGDKITVCYKVPLQSKIIINNKTYFLSILFSPVDPITNYLISPTGNDGIYNVKRDKKNEFNEVLYSNDSLLVYLSKDQNDIEYTGYEIPMEDRDFYSQDMAPVKKTNSLYKLGKLMSKGFKKGINTMNYAAKKARENISSLVPSKTVLPADYIFTIYVDNEQQRFIIPKMRIIKMGEIEYIEYYKVNEDISSGKKKTIKKTDNKNKTIKKTGNKNKKIKKRKNNKNTKNRKKYIKRSNKNINNI